MPDISNVDAERIKSVASQLDGIVDRLNGGVGKFADAIDTLDKGWVSEVKVDFMSAYQADREAMQEMLAQLREISDGLREAASDFEKTENETLSSIKGLR